MVARTMTAMAMAAVLVAGPALAQQVPADPSPAPSGAPVLVAASAGLPEGDAEAQAPTADQAQPATVPAKPRRAARVTTCRCGTPDGQ